MKIILKVDDDIDSELDFVLTDEDLDNPNFVELLLTDKDGDITKSIMISVEDLYRAVAVFEGIRLDNREDMEDED